MARFTAYNHVMAAHDLDRLRRAADALTQEERREFALYLLRENRGVEAKTADINSLRGSIRLSIDPVEYQHASRADNG